MTFGESMRALMAERGISLRALAKKLPADLGYLSKLSRDLKMPSVQMAERIDTALAAGGELAALRSPALRDTLNGHFTPDDEERLRLAVQRPARLDLTVVDSLGTILAAQRRLDDTLGPAAILPATVAEAGTVETLLREARGPVREALAPVAGEWVQFHGWLLAELRDDRAAVRRLTDAEDLADEIENGELAAQAANFKGYLARQQDRPRGIVRHFMTAYHTPGAAPAQRLGDAVQAAQGYALIGETAAARRLLDEAAALEDKAAASLPPGTAYWLTPHFHHINIGLALAALGEHAAAAEHIAAGLGSLPEDQQHAEWTREYRDALNEARARS